MVGDSVEIEKEITASETAGIPISYYHMERRKYETIHSCQGDLIVICNILADYRELLSEYLNFDENRLDECGKMQYELYIKRCLKIQKLLESELGYDRDAAVEKCRKKKGKSYSDVGEDALTLSARQRNQQKKEAPEIENEKNN